MKLIFDWPRIHPISLRRDFRIFSELKKLLAVDKVLSNEVVTDAMESYFADLDESVSKMAGTILQCRCTECINLEGDCIEK